jgi:NADH dehydrogenase
MWGFIHVMYLVGWGNRLGTVYTWARALWFSKNRGHRIITFETARDDIAEGRTAAGRPSPILPRAARPVESTATSPPRSVGDSG